MVCSSYHVTTCQLSWDRISEELRRSLAQAKLVQNKTRSQTHIVMIAVAIVVWLACLVVMGRITDCWFCSIIRCLRKPSTNSSAFGRRSSSTNGCCDWSTGWNVCLAVAGSLGGLSLGGLSLGGLWHGGLSVGGLTRPVAGCCLQLDAAAFSELSAVHLFCQQSTTDHHWQPWSRVESSTTNIIVSKAGEGYDSLDGVRHEMRLSK